MGYVSHFRLDAANLSRVKPSMSKVGLLLISLGLLASTASCASLLGDPAYDARSGCKKDEGPACFRAGSLVAEKTGPNSDAVRLFLRGCALRHSPSCDALATLPPEFRERALASACDAGDALSCVRRAAGLGSSEPENVEARAVRHEICRRSASLSSGATAREVEAFAEACSALAVMIADGRGGGADFVAAAKLDVLAQTLRNEALYRHEREDDAKVLPSPAPPARPAPKGIKRAPPPDPVRPERERFHAEYAARRAAREAWFTSVGTGTADTARQRRDGDPTAPKPSALERAVAAFGPPSSAGVSTCQACVESCNSAGRCGGDDFVGGKCAHITCAGAAPCAEREACTSSCAAEAESCVKACGECAPVPVGKVSK
jgi:hypothetical protein